MRYKVKEKNIKYLKNFLKDERNVVSNKHVENKNKIHK